MVIAIDKVVTDGDDIQVMMTESSLPATQGASYVSIFPVMGSIGGGLFGTPAVRHWGTGEVDVTCPANIQLGVDPFILIRVAGTTVALRTPPGHQFLPAPPPAWTTLVGQRVIDTSGAPGLPKAPGFRHPLGTVTSTTLFGEGFYNVSWAAGGTGVSVTVNPVGSSTAQHLARVLGIL